MRIKEEQLEFSALQIIDDIVGCPWEYAEAGADNETIRATTLGAVYGVLLLVKELKEVLKG